MDVTRRKDKTSLANSRNHRDSVSYADDWESKILRGVCPSPSALRDELRIWFTLHQKSWQESKWLVVDYYLDGSQDETILSAEMRNAVAYGHKWSMKDLKELLNPTAIHVAAEIRIRDRTIEAMNPRAFALTPIVLWVRWALVFFRKMGWISSRRRIRIASIAKQLAAAERNYMKNHILSISPLRSDSKFQLKNFSRII